MNRSQTYLMSVEGLESYALEIETNINSLGAWVALANSKAGQDLLKELRRKLNVVRGFYQKIPASNPSAPTLLAGIQGKEEEIESMIQKLSNSENYKKTLDEELTFVLNMRNKREESERPKRQSIVSDAAKPKD